MATLVSVPTDAFNMFQSLKGFQRFCGGIRSCERPHSFTVSIPKRVSEVLWRYEAALNPATSFGFQSLKGFQRFCGISNVVGGKYSVMGFNP